MKQYLLIILVAFPSLIWAQTPSDAVMMKQRESCFALIYDQVAFDDYWEGTDLRDNATIATVTRYTVLPMIAIGLHDRVNLILGLPYVKTESSEPNGGRLEGAKGFQDLNIAVKVELLNKKIGPGKLAALTNVGYSTPSTNYLSDYRPYSLGFGANEFSLRGILQYKLDMGVYVRVTGAYLWRGQTKVERDYYYANGSYYTPWMDVPDAWNYQAVAGIKLFDNSLLFELQYSSLKSTSGDDIRKYNAPQPTNKVNEDQVGVKAQYYFKQLKGLGVLGYYQQVIDGRNTAKFNGFGAGVTYQFKI
jgi:hypothetical protein